MVSKETNLPLFPILDNTTAYIATRLGGAITTLCFTLYSLYIEAALLAGCSKIGLNFLTLITVAELKLNSTWTSSFLIHLFLILISNNALIHFCAVNLPKLTENTTARFLFKNVISETPAFKWAFGNKIFEILILIFAVISWLFLYLWRRCCKDWGKFDFGTDILSGKSGGLKAAKIVYELQKLK